MDIVESSDTGAAAEVPSWASLNPPSNTAPRLEPMSEQSADIAPRLGPMNEQTTSTSSTLGLPDLITVESADGVREIHHQIGSGQFRG